MIEPPPPVMCPASGGSLRQGGPSAFLRTGHVSATPVWPSGYPRGRRSGHCATWARRDLRDVSGVKRGAVAVEEYVAESM